MHVCTPNFGARKASLHLRAGVMQNIFDGIQRPLKTIAEVSGDCFIPRGVNVPALDVVKTWEFTPTDFKVRRRPPPQPQPAC